MSNDLIKRLVEAQANSVALIDGMIKIIIEHMSPNGISKDTALGELIYLLNRETRGATKAAVASLADAYLARPDKGDSHVRTQ